VGVESVGKLRQPVGDEHVIGAPGRQGAGRGGEEASLGQRPGLVGSGRGEQLGANREHELDVDPRRNLDLGVVLPGCEVVGVGVHTVRPAALLTQLHEGFVAIRSLCLQGHRMARLGAVRGGEQKHHPDEVMSFAESGGAERNDLPDK